MNARTLFFLLSLIVLSFELNAQCSSSNHKSNRYVRTVSFQHTPDIIDIAASDAQFGTLVAAVKAAGLAETLKGDGPFTVFAPVNSAFAKLPDGTVASLLKPESKGQLTKVLTYHVVAGEFFASDVINAIKSSGGSFTVETVSGDKLTASLSNDSVILEDESGNRIAVTKTDIDASNGVIHVIDSVLLPK